jgi:hypothetical protein
LSDFEASTGYRDFKLFRVEQAQSYKRKLVDATNPETGRPLAKATISSRLAALKAFFQWLSLQPRFKSRLTYSDAEYFNASAKDERIAKATRERPVPSLRPPGLNSERAGISKTRVWLVSIGRMQRPYAEFSRMLSSAAACRTSILTASETRLRR